MNEPVLTSQATPLVQRRLEQFQRDNARVMARYFAPDRRSLPMIGQFLALGAEQRQEEWELTRKRFASRHRDFSRVLRRHFAKLHQWLLGQEQEALAGQIAELPEQDQLLLAAYATSEYSVESAAFFNPAIVPHPSQEGVAPGGLRFIMSFRATGEGHISSVAFRSGVIAADAGITLDPVSPYISAPTIELHRTYDKMLFARKLQEMGSWNAFAGAIVARLPEHFTRLEMEYAFRDANEPCNGSDREMGIKQMRWLAECNYRISFEDDEDVCERVIFPVSRGEANGIEDARFVRFTDDDGSMCYYATYTAFSGQSAAVQMIETRDFQEFDITTLNGPAVRDKGMALFPRRLGGDYVMLGRQDGRSITVARSRDRHFWYEYRPVIEPREPWELVKLGNCGSPIETSAGWLVLTHGVGAVRRYCIGAVLLDRDDPTKVLGRLKRPLIEPLESEREGYVPNVVYTCGALLHRDMLIIPYAMSDTRSGIASANIDELLAALAE